MLNLRSRGKGVSEYPFCRCRKNCLPAGLMGIEECSTCLKPPVELVGLKMMEGLKVHIEVLRS